MFLPSLRLNRKAVHAYRTCRRAVLARRRTRALSPSYAPYRTLRQVRTENDVKRILTITRRPVVITKGPKVAPGELRTLLLELQEMRDPAAAKEPRHINPKCPTCGK